MKFRWTSMAAWLAAWAVLVVLAWLFGLPELAALATAATTTVLISALWLLGAHAPTVEADVVPSTVNQGDPASLRITFGAPPRRRSAPARLWGRLGTAGEGIVAAAPLEPGARTTVRVALPTPVRGVVRIGPLSMRLNDPLRIWHRDRDADCAVSLLVRPALHQISDTDLAGGRRPAHGQQLSAGLASTDADADLVGLRPYVRGDDVRRIHWRTSARLGEPHVVQVEPPVRSPGTTVLLDQGPNSTPEGFERCVSAAASILVAAGNAGRHVRLICSGADATVADSDSIPATAVGDLLDALATVGRHPDAGAYTEDLASPGEDTLVWCTASTATVLEPPPGVDVVVSCDGTADPDLRGGTLHVRWRAGSSLAEAWQAAGSAIGAPR